MKSCVVTANYACDPNKVWLYLTKPTLNNWRKDGQRLRRKRPTA